MTAGHNVAGTDVRERVSSSARRLFYENGFDSTTVEEIAQDAGVSADSVRQLVGDKDRIFVAALGLPVDPTRVLPTIVHGPRDQLGERIVRLMLDTWDEPAHRDRLLTLIRSATTDEAIARMLREFLGAAVLRPAATACDVAPLRLTGMAGQVMGLALLRYVIRLEPLASADADDVVALAAPTVQHYLTNA